MQKKVRQSNMELLRVIAMFLVLLVHVDFFSLGVPSEIDCANDTYNSSLRVFFEAISITCVDIFVCLSGWFGIRASFRGFSNFIFQCLFWLIGLYVVTMVLGLSSFSVEGVKGCFALTKLNWFIKAYVLLYIVTPVLNAFIEKATRGEFKMVLIAFFIFEFIYGWLFSSATEFIAQGYSTISFMGLYLLTRYIRIYQPGFANLSKSFYTGYIIIAPILLTVCYVVPPILGINTTLFGAIWISYLSPYCILFAVSMVLLFSKIQIQNKMINWLGASSFAVFLIHTNPNTLWHYKDFFENLYAHVGGGYFWIYAFLMMVAIFIVAILIDQLRLFVWNYIWDRFIYKNDRYC